MDNLLLIMNAASLFFCGIFIGLLWFNVWSFLKKKRTNQLNSGINIAWIFCSVCYLIVVIPTFF